ncbi:unnamed protein product [Prorocentrum cordatum]|uniref:Uncharacterized protein n=1 Tax=Prorocentrum cordatum TaxID=2364126 RepID=A0ABN9VYJ9_9DINO|nr:unnamed protein product [Polarella glacialis]
MSFSFFTTYKCIVVQIDSTVAYNDAYTATADVPKPVYKEGSKEDEDSDAEGDSAEADRLEGDTSAEQDEHKEEDVDANASASSGADASLQDLEFTRGGFHDFARDHINATSGKRRPSKQLAPAAAAQEGAAKVLFAALEGLHSARLAHAFGALAGELRRTRRTAGPSVATLGGESSDIMRELLQAQCRASVELEHRVKMAGRVGGLVLCLASLQRTQLRYSWMRWTELAPDEWLPMPPELAGRGASPFAPPLPHQLAGGGQVAAARAVFAGAPEGSRSGSAASRGTPPPGRGGGGAVGHKLTE